MRIHFHSSTAEEGKMFQLASCFVTISFCLVSFIIKMEVGENVKIATRIFHVNNLSVTFTHTLVNARRFRNKINY